MTIFGHLVKSRDPALLNKTEYLTLLLSSIRENLTLVLIWCFKLKIHDTNALIYPKAEKVKSQVKAMEVQGNYQVMNVNEKDVKDVRIELMQDGAKYLSKTVTYNTEIPLQAPRKFSGKAVFLTASQPYVPEPCIFLILRWCFSILALVVLIFVLLMFIAMLYDVASRSGSGK